MKYNLTFDLKVNIYFCNKRYFNNRSFHINLINNHSFIIPILWPTQIGRVYINKLHCIVDGCRNKILVPGADFAASTWPYQTIPVHDKMSRVFLIWLSVSHYLLCQNSVYMPKPIYSANCYLGIKLSFSLTYCLLPMIYHYIVLVRYGKCYLALCIWNDLLC